MDSFLLGIGSWILAKAFLLAWWATLVCVLFSGRIATAFLRDAPRPFTVMALFACAWMLVLGYYSDKVGGATSAELADLVSDLGAFLLVYVGGLLVLETSARGQDGDETHVVTLQILALYLLLFIAAPRALEIIAPGGVKLLGVSQQNAKYFVSGAMVVIGFVSVGLGAWRIASGVPLATFLAIVTIYALVDLYGSTYCIWKECGKGGQLTPVLALVFSALKLLFTFNFGCIVAQYGMSPDMRAAGWWYWIRHFIYVAGSPRKTGRGGGSDVTRR